MSKLLERAIVDANALKEAALKSAEQLVIEKYSDEVREAVNNIIEQDLGSDLDLAMGELGGMDMEPTGEDPLDGASDITNVSPEEQEEEQSLDPESLMGGLPDSFNSDEDEVISIKLDSLEAESDDDEIGVFGGDDEYSDDEIGIDILDDEEEMEFEDEEVGLEPDTGDSDIGVDVAGDMVQEILDELGVSQEDVNMDEILEAVRVDFEPQKSGWAGTPETIMREYESMLLAREQDSEVKEENGELRKIVSSLQKENKTLTSAATKLQMQTEKYETAFNTLQEKLETMNVSNAKLLYINQALENASLNERQKRKIVEAISKADTVQEAKIVFDTMSDAVSTTSDVKRDETLNEVVSRRSSLLVAARNEQPNKDANPLYNRLQKLAGIKTN